jgi:hypothetical protein
LRTENIWSTEEYLKNGRIYREWENI